VLRYDGETVSDDFSTVAASGRERGGRETGRRTVLLLDDLDLDLELTDPLLELL